MKGRFEDLTGQKFNRWTVIKRVENNKSGQAQWLCRCECGTERVLISTWLKRGGSKSCGCLAKEIQRKLQTEKNKKRLKDLTGKHIGKLTVIKRVENNKHGNPQWLCKCDCGNELITTGSNLNKGHVHSCGCIHRLDDKIIGKKFGKLTVIRYVESRNHCAYYEAKCDCGNTIITSGSSIYTGASKSCGCVRNEKLREQASKDLVGQKFGKLTVVSKEEPRASNRRKEILWLCKCDCGGEKIVPTNSLTSGMTKSCGCLEKERNEKSKKRLLKESYKRAYRRHYHIFGIEITIPNWSRQEKQSPEIKENNEGIVEI